MPFLWLNQFVVLLPEIHLFCFRYFFKAIRGIITRDPFVFFFFVFFCFFSIQFVVLLPEIHLFFLFVYFLKSIRGIIARDPFVFVIFCILFKSIRGLITRGPFVLFFFCLINSSCYYQRSAPTSLCVTVKWCSLFSSSPFL